MMPMCINIARCKPRKLGLYFLQVDIAASPQFPRIDYPSLTKVGLSDSKITALNNLIGPQKKIISNHWLTYTARTDTGNCMKSLSSHSTYFHSEPPRKIACMDRLSFIPVSTTNIHINLLIFIHCV